MAGGGEDRATAGAAGAWTGAPAGLARPGAHVAARRCLRGARPLPRHACEPATATPVVWASLALARLSLGCSRASRRLSADAVGGLARGI